jgi:hypothetical protein
MTGEEHLLLEQITGIVAIFAKTEYSKAWGELDAKK